MATLSTLTPWVNRKATQDRGEKFIVLRKAFVADELKYSSGTTALAANDFVPLWEIPFGSTIINARANVLTDTTGSCIFDLGVYGFTTYTGTTFAGTGSTGADIDGILDGIELDTAGVFSTTGVLIGRKLDERVFTDSDELNQPLYIALKAITLTAQPDAGVWDLFVEVLLP